MANTYWYRQGSEPLFPELLWSRPENKLHAGKLLILGGNLHAIAAPAEAYNEAVKAGIGSARVLLPDAVKKIVGPILENGEFAPSTPSGSFSQKALDEFLSMAGWSDGVLLAGDFGRNSETAILLEKAVNKYEGPLVITKDALDYFLTSPLNLLQREETVLVLSLGQLQKLAMAAQFRQPITHALDLIRLVDTLHEFTRQFTCAVVVKHLDHICVAYQGKVSSTTSTAKIWRVVTAAHSAVWQLQHSEKAFEALTTAMSSLIPAASDSV
jgi:NAD(P)H-hydrate repair Nnr-like enzyme with NAD(P)H-hydrate dehydratase domain